MKKSNLVKSLIRVINNSKGLLILCLSIAVFGVNEAWGDETYYYAKLSVKSSTGHGKVYVEDQSTTNSTPATKTKKSEKNTKSVSFTIKADNVSGYSFKWGDNNTDFSRTITVSTSKEKDTDPQDGGTYDGQYTAKNDTKYTVKHYKQNLAGTGYDLADTDNLTGTTDEKVTPARKSYTGFTAPESKELTIKGDGSASVSYNYTRNSYTLTWNLDGGTITTAGTPAGQVKYGATLSAPVPSKTGAQFKGWSPEVPATMPAENVTYTALWVSKYDFEMSGEDRSMKVDEELPNAFAFTHAENPEAHISNTNIITYDAANNKLVAHQEGTATIYFTQAETTNIYAGTSDTYTITVSKIANTLAADATKSMKVDETWSGVFSGKNSDGIITTESTDASVAYFDVTNNKIVAQNTGNQSFTSKEVTITISQAATYKYTAAEKTIKVTVNKWDNNIFINGSQDSYQASIYMDAEHSIALTATNTDYSGSPITATQTAGNTIATLNTEQTQVTSNHNLGDATWTVSQPENYKYKAANASFTIHVVKETEATDCYVLNPTGEASLNTIAKGNAIAISGPADKLYFDIKYDGTLFPALYLHAEYSTDNGNNWTDATEINERPENYKTFGPYQLPSNATHVCFETTVGSTNKVYYKNVRVTRKTYLNAANVEITETSSHNPVHPNEVGVGTLTINHSLANGGNLKVKWDNDKFTIDGKTAAQGIDLGDLGCSTGISNLPISYTSKVVGTDIANVVIYNNVYRATATIKGTTIKRDQNIQWNTDIMIVGQTEANAAQTTSIINGVVTYTSDDTDIIRVKADDNGQLTILEALQPGTTNITAFSAGNEEYNDAQSTKEITVTDKQIQYITWNQSLMGLKMGDADVSLNASAYQPDSLNCLTGGQRPITYSSANTAVVEIVDGNKLRIKGIGVTTVTASQAGGTDGDGHDFIAVTAEKKVVVRDPNAPCETYIYEQTSEVTFDLGWNAAFHQTKTYEIDFNGKEPGFVNFDYKGKVHTVLIDYYAGTLSIEQYVNNQWVEVRNFGKPGTSEYTNTGDIALDRKATKMRVKAADGMGYMYFKDCRVTLARYLEGSNLSKFETKVGSPLTKTLNVNYSNISGPVTFTLSENSNFSLSKESIEGECGGYGSTTIDITYTPTQEAIGESATLTLADDIQKTQITLEGNAAVTPLHINWDIPSENSCYTLDEITLSATALTDLNIEVPNFVWFSLAQNSTTGNITGNTLSFTKAGIANVIAQTTGDPRYTPAQNIFKKWTVNLTPTTITTNPTISGDIISGTDMASLILNGGAVQNNVNNQAVEGTFAVTAGDLVNVGEQTLTVTFTPNNTDMYEGCTTTITANVVQREATAEEKGTPSAAPITYGSVINTSALSGNGTLAGTWSWVDEEANKATPNVGTVDNLNVIFTPNDGNVKQATNTVSLSVTAATPTLTWTATPEAAQVHETKTFTASSTNTDNTAAITYSIISGSECATINETTGEVTMTKAGTITVQASQVATTNFNAPEPIKTTCTISLAPTTITTNPTISSDIVSGTALNEIVLEGGAAKNTINNQAVEGTFAVTGGETTAVGEQTLTITFAPTEADKYASCTTTISATVIQRTPTQEEVGTPSAADIEYGAAVNTSVLTGNGTLDGTWSWIDNRKDDVLPVGTHDGLQVLFTPTDGNVRTVDAVVSLTIIGEMENKFIGEGDWDNADNWTNGVPTGENPNVVISGSLTISNPISVGGLTIENTGKVNIVEDGDLTVNGTSAERETYGNLFVRNGGNITIHENAEVKVYDFVVESSIGTQNGTSISGQVENSNKVIYTNGAYIDINMDPDGTMDDTQWYGFTVPFPVDVQNGVARKEGETFRKCTYGSDYMIAEYDMNQRLNTGKGWKYIKTGQLQPGHFYYFTVNGNYNTYSFKAAETTFTIQTETAITTNGEGANANWNAVGNSTMMYANISGDNLPAYVQTYVNGESRYQVVNTTDAQFVVGCPFFIQATKATTMVLNKATEMQNILHYAPRSEETAQPICVRIAEEGQRFSDQMYITASEDALDTYELGRDLAKAGIGTKSAQLWVNAYKQSLCVNDAPLIDKKAYYDVTLYAPKAGSYEISLPRIPNNGTLYLTQNGMPMWNLNESDYSIECAKGNNNEYGLLFIESEQSGDGSMTNNPTLNDNNQWQKVLVNQHVYILQNGSVYDITGQKVK